MSSWENFKSLFSPHQKVVFPLLALIIVGGGAYIAFLSLEVFNLKREIVSTQTFLEGKIDESKTFLAKQIDDDRQNIALIKEKVGIFEEEVGSISGTVDSLEKLSKVDPELLQKYSKVFFLNEHYDPKTLTNITSKFSYFEDRELQIHTKVWPDLREMLEDALDDDVELYVYSAYRSFGTQASLKGQYTTTYGQGANQFSADQGYSEHQLGTTIDLITTGMNGNLTTAFENTDAYKWLEKNAHKYGFILSYPKNNEYYIFEPWHWRFVGKELAEYLHDTGKDFYDVDQREIDEYLISIFD